MGVEPARTHDVAEILIRESHRFPTWFGALIARMAAISTEMGHDRALAFYGDERQQKGPRELFGEADAKRAREDMHQVAEWCARLLTESLAPERIDAESEPDAGILGK